MVAGYHINSFQIPLENNTVNNLNCLSFILIDKEYGPMMFDTGSPYEPEQLETVLDKNFSLKLDDIKWVFNTHMHIDHIGLNFRLKNATIVCSKDEFNHINEMVSVALNDKINFLEYLHKTCPGYKGYLTEFDAETLKKLVKQYWPGQDVVDRMNVKFIEDSPNIPDIVTPIPAFGHTMNHYAYEIKTSKVNFYVVGDAISNRLDYALVEGDTPSEPQADIKQYFSTMKKFSKYKGVIVPGHDRPFFSYNYKSIKKTVFNIDELAIPE